MVGRAKFETVRVVLTPDMAELVKQAIASGEYPSSGEVILEALAVWKHHRALKLQEQDELRVLWAEGLSSGASRFSGIDEIRQEARRQLAADMLSLGE